jgi:hypothetical protein
MRSQWEVYYKMITNSMMDVPNSRQLNSGKFSMEQYGFRLAQLTQMRVPPKRRHICDEVLEHLR